MLTDSSLMTRKEKENIVKQMKSFLKNNLQQKSFKASLCQYLQLGHLSVSSQDDYYSTYFSQPESKLAWAREFTRCKDHEELKDINKALKDMVSDYMDNNHQALREQIKDRDIKQAKELMSKHGFLFLPQTATNVLVFQKK